jgi:hypothetical protein
MTQPNNYVLEGGASNSKYLLLIRSVEDTETSFFIALIKYNIPVQFQN